MGSFRKFVRGQWFSVKMDFALPSDTAVSRIKFCCHNRMSLALVSRGKGSIKHHMMPRKALWQISSISNVSCDEFGNFALSLTAATLTPQGGQSRQGCCPKQNITVSTTHLGTEKLLQSGFTKCLNTPGNSLHKPASQCKDCGVSGLPISVSSCV